MTVEIDGANNIVKTNTISEVTSANGVTVDGLNIKDSKLVTADSVIEANMSANSVDSDSYVDGSIDGVHLSSNVITGQTAETSVANDDLVLLSDTSASAGLKKMTVANLVANAGGGKILQAVSVHIDSEVLSTSGTFADLTGFSLSITPSASNSKILVSVFSSMYVNTTSGVQTGATTKFLRNVGGGSYSNLSTQSAGNSVIISDVYGSGNNNAMLSPFTILLIDEPATTSAVNYKCQGSATWGGNARWNYDSISGYMTALEIGA